MEICFFMIIYLALQPIFYNRGYNKKKKKNLIKCLTPAAYAETQFLKTTRNNHEWMVDVSLESVRVKSDWCGINSEVSHLLTALLLSMSCSYLLTAPLLFMSSSDWFDVNVFTNSLRAIPNWALLTPRWKLVPAWQEHVDKIDKKKWFTPKEWNHEYVVFFSNFNFLMIYNIQVSWTH